MQADEFQSQRLHMVDRQLRSRGIQNKAVLMAMSNVPRHRFVYPADDYLAYGDYPLAIGYDQTISLTQKIIFINYVTRQ